MMRTLLLALLVGCVPSSVVVAPMEDAPAEGAIVRVIHGDTRFLPAERATALAAAEHVAQLTDGHARAYFVWDFDETRFIALADEPHMLRTPKEFATREGGGSTDAIRVVVENCPDLLACMEHELGHFFGMNHPTYSAPHSVMQERNAGARWTHTDRAECVRVRLCRPIALRDNTTVTLTIDPDVPRVEPEYPKW